MHRLNDSGRESKTELADYDSDLPVTLKHGKGHQIWYEFVDPEQEYNDGKFERP